MTTEAKAVFTIATSATASSQVSIHNDLLGFYVPATFAATSVYFETTRDNGATWVPVHFEGARYNVTVAVSTYQAVDPRAFLGLKVIRMVAASSLGADCEVYLEAGGLS